MKVVKVFKKSPGVLAIAHSVNDGTAVGALMTHVAPGENVYSEEEFKILSKHDDFKQLLADEHVEVVVEKHKAHEEVHPKGEPEEHHTKGASKHGKEKSSHKK